MLLVLGWRLRTRRPNYALALQGGAVGILYLTVLVLFGYYAVVNASILGGPRGSEAARP